MSWYEQIAELGVARVARTLGLQVGGAHGNVNQGISPCPSCGAEKRGSRDRRGPVGIRPDDRGWRCHRCDAHGDPVNLAAWVLLGEYKPTGSRWRELQSSCADAGLCDWPAESTGSFRHRVHQGRRKSPARVCSDSKRIGPTRRATSAPIRPPAAEVQALWEDCRPVTSDSDVAAWLIGRGLEPEICAECDVVRALPARARLPEWAQFGRPWTHSSHRVIIPMYGPGGQLETVHARALSPRDHKGRDKAASPKGAQVAGTIMADRNGLDLLRAASATSTTQTTYTLASARGSATPTILIAEGVPDFLTWTTQYAGDQNGPAVLGIIAGSWNDELAGRIPDGARVLIRTHDDKAGHKYAQRIGTTLRDRCQVFCRTSVETR